MRESYTYTAFLSYSHRDKKLATWLHRWLESYKVPKNLIGKKTVNGVVPEKLGRFFRDQDELPVTDDLTSEVQKAIVSSKFMIVLCSPAAAASRWVNKEIIEFKKLHGDKYVLPLIIDGEPFATKKGRPKDECFPPAIRFKLGADGLLSPKELEPAAADIRRRGDGKQRALLKLVAGMLGVGLDELVERELRRKQRRVMAITAASVVAMLVMGVLTLEAISARKAADRNRGEAEDLIEFMLTDLRDKLEPVGRLDALDVVGGKVLDYYDNQSRYEAASDDSIGRKSRALHLLGELQFLRDRPKEAMRLFNQSAEATEELLKRAPLNTQRIFEHAQSVFWVAEQARQRGDLRQVEVGYREYKRLADKLVELEPHNLDWHIEVAYGNLNMGIISLGNAKNPREALEYFEKALVGFDAALQERPDSAQLLSDIANTLVWIHSCLRRTSHVTAVLENFDLLEKYIQIAFAMDARSQFAKEWQIYGYMFKALNYRDIGNHPASLEFLEKAISLMDEWSELEPEAVTPYIAKVSALIHISMTSIDLGLLDQASRYLDSIAWDSFYDKGQGGSWEALEKFKSQVVRASLAIRQEKYDQAQKLLPVLESQVTVHQGELLGSQSNLSFLLMYYRLKIELLVKKGESASALQLSEHIWGLVNKNDFDKFPSVLSSMKNIADLVGDTDVSERVARVLLERGYLRQGDTPASDAETIN